MSLFTVSVPSSFVAFADMTGIKLVGLGLPDLSVYSVAQDNPYQSNIAAVVYDPANHGFYYSQVNTRKQYVDQFEV